MRGDAPNPNNSKWKQSLPTLIDEDQFVHSMDTVLSEVLARRLRHLWGTGMYWVRAPV